MQQPNPEEVIPSPRPAELAGGGKHFDDLKIITDVHLPPQPTPSVNPISKVRIPSMTPNTIRGIITAITGAATAIGILPAEVHAVIEANAAEAVGAILTLWGIVAALRK